MKKLLSILMTLLLVVLSLGSVPTIIYADEMPTFIGPNDSDHAYLDFHSNGENYSFYFMGGIGDASLEGVRYDLESNTLTLTDYNEPSTIIEASEMGSDFKIVVNGENKIKAITILADRYMGSLSIEGEGSLSINEENDYDDAPLFIDANNTDSVLKVEDTVQLSICANSEDISVKVLNSNIDDSIISANTEYRISSCDESSSQNKWINAHDTQMNTFWAVKDSDCYTTLCWDEFAQDSLYYEFVLVKKMIDGEEVVFADPTMDDMGNPNIISSENVDNSKSITACQIMNQYERAAVEKVNDETEYTLTEYTSDGEGPFWDVYKVMHDEDLGPFFYLVAEKLTVKPEEYTPVQETINNKYVYIEGNFENYEKEDSNDYLLWVNDEQFSNEHLTISCGSGTATYNPTDNILTLTDAQITKGTSVDFLGSGILSRIDNLTINVIGNCSITNTDGEGISTYDQNELYENIPHDINITGAGTLTINENTAYYGYGLYSTGKISVEGTKINIESANSSIWAEDNITIKDSELCLKAIAVSNPYYEMGMGEETIGGYGIVSNKGTIAIDNCSMSVDSEKNSAFLTGTNVDESKILLSGCELSSGDFSEASVTIEKLADTHIHSYASVWNSDATNHWHECDCGDKRDVAAHTMEVVAEGINATCFSTGLSDGFRCKVCDYEERQKETPMIAHQWDKGTVTKQPTTTDAGIKTYKCTTFGCSETKTEVIDKLSDITKPSDNTNPSITLKKQKITTTKIKSIKVKTLKKKKVTIKLKAKASGKGKLTYKVTKYPKGMKKYIKVSKKGVVTLKKKAKKGKYKIAITAAAKGSYKKATKTITIKVK